MNYGITFKDLVLNCQTAKYGMQRLFTFGCSFTQYWRWPTWADALGQQASYFENWGLCGAGNSYIFNSLIECNQRHRLTADDTVIIMWTNTSREDRYVKDHWLGMGNIYWTAGQELPAEYVKRYACERGYLIRDLAFAAAAQDLLNTWKCNWKFFSMVPLTHTNLDIDLGSNPLDTVSQDHDVRNLYRSTLEAIRPSVYETVFDNKWWTGSGIPDSYDPKQRDFHPTPSEHLAYLASVCPEIPLEEHAINWMQNWEHKIKNNTDIWPSPNLPTRL